MVSVGTIFLYAIFSCHFYHGFIGLRTGILEKDLIHSDGGAHFFGQKCLRDGIGVVEGLHQRTSLLDNCLDYPLVAVAGGINGDSRIKVEVSLALLVIDGYYVEHQTCLASFLVSDLRLDSLLNISF